MSHWDHQLLVAYWGYGISHQVAPVGTCSSAQDFGTQILPDIAHVSLLLSVCKSPVVTPYFVDRGSHPVFELSVPTALSKYDLFFAALIFCPAHVVVTTGADVTVAFLNLIDVGGGAALHDGAAVTVMFGIDVEHTSTISCSWLTR
jgi:hypothetical protein